MALMNIFAHVMRLTPHSVHSKLRGIKPKEIKLLFLKKNQHKISKKILTGEKNYADLKHDESIITIFSTHNNHPFLENMKAQTKIIKINIFVAILCILYKKCYVFANAIVSLFSETF